MTRIAFFASTLAGGGAERVLLNLANGFSQMGWSVDLLLKEKAGAYLSQIPDGITVIDLHAHRLSAAIPGLARYLRAQRPAALISGLEIANQVAVLARLFSGTRVPVITTTHSMVSFAPEMALPLPIINRGLARLIYTGADALVAVSHGVARDLEEYLRLPAGRVRVIYNPVLTPDFERKKQEPLEHPWFAPGQPPVILAAGRLEAVKNFKILIEAFQQVRLQTQARLLILGEGSLRAELEAQVRQLGLEQDVLLPGFEKNVYAFMSKSRVFVLSSIFEGLPTVLIEALACGCPVVAADCPGGTRELLRDGAYGHLVPVNDGLGLAQGMLAALAGDQRPAPASWLEQFQLSSVCQQYLDLIQAQGYK